MFDFDMVGHRMMAFFIYRNFCRAQFSKLPVALFFASLSVIMLPDFLFSYR
ncbi:hypothetical protein [Pseudocitrobacter vendiensis]|uniref:Uncharacterized protein n=1 Tax=Pseudocitrobacter vendiensis TaxID=2488306 RepID=A0ABN8T5J1_9ENTR|nr:hypothetical protein [Pseudocitrobacter vendiensis]CAH6635383.1 hypothetical protein FBBNIHIM_00940 [Pseudocitrobacter vendiensis]